MCADENTQEILLHTTVPQSIVRQDLSSRHEPTKKSLRRSKKVSRTELESFDYDRDSTNRLARSHHFFIIGTLLVNFIFGVILNILSVWKFLSLRNFPTEATEYFTGLIVCLSNMLALSSKVFGGKCWNKDGFRIFLIICMTFSVIICVYVASSHLFQLYKLYIVLPGCADKEIANIDSTTYCTCHDKSLSIKLKFPQTCRQIKTILPLFLTLSSATELASMIFATISILLEIQLRKNLSRYSSTLQIL